MATNTNTHREVVLSTEGLRVGRGDTAVLDNVNLKISAGEIFGIVGPARSGKTALLETLIGLRPPLAGRVHLLGSDTPESDAVRQHVGSSLRPSTVERRTKVVEVLRLSASLYAHHTDVERLIEAVGLSSQRNTYRERLAPHELARLSLAMGLVSDPTVLFADEPTRELDPKGRHDMWDLIRSRRDAGMTIVLSTNQMDEAERLCDRVAILGNGRLLAVDTPERLISSGGTSERMVLDASGPIPAGLLADLPGIGEVSVSGTSARVVVTNPGLALQSIAALMTEGRLGVRSLRLAQTTLEDRFVELMNTVGTTRHPA
jgi:ABC-2 type transport system ATP-binding protein